MLIKVNGETIILKSKMKYWIKTLKSKSYEFNVCKIQNISELPERKVESKSPCLVYKTNMLNVGFA